MITDHARRTIAVFLVGLVACGISAADEVEPKVLVSQEAPLWSASFSPDGKTLLTGDDAGWVRTWNISDGSQRGRQVNPDKPPKIRAIAFPPTGNRLAYAYQGKVVVEDLQGNQIHTLPVEMDRDSPMDLAFSKDGRWLAMAAPQANWVYHWDVTDGDEGPRLTSKNAVSVEFTPDGNALVVGCGGNFVDWWEVPAGSLDTTLYRAGINVRFSPDGRILATDNLLWDAKTRKLKAMAIPESGSTWSSCFSPDGAWYATVGGDRQLKMWDMVHNKPLTVQRIHDKAVTAIDVSPDGKTIATCSFDGTLKLWDVPQLLKAGTVDSIPQLFFSRTTQQAMYLGDSWTQWLILSNREGIARINNKIMADNKKKVATTMAGELGLTLDFTEKKRSLQQVFEAIGAIEKSLRKDQNQEAVTAYNLGATLTLLVNLYDPNNTKFADSVLPGIENLCRQLEVPNDLFAMVEAPVKARASQKELYDTVETFWGEVQLYFDRAVTIQRFFSDRSARLVELSDTPQALESFSLGYIWSGVLFSLLSEKKESVDTTERIASALGVQLPELPESSDKTTVYRYFTTEVQQKMTKEIERRYGGTAADLYRLGIGLQLELAIYDPTKDKALSDFTALSFARRLALPEDLTKPLADAYQKKVSADEFKIVVDEFAVNVSDGLAQRGVLLNQ